PAGDRPRARRAVGLDRDHLRDLDLRSGPDPHRRTRGDAAADRTRLRCFRDRAQRILSPLLLGELRGPLTTPIGAVAVLATNAVWGVITGAIALALQRAR